MDIREYNNYIEGFIIRREMKINDLQNIGHKVAGKTAQAIWGDKSFKRTIPDVKLREEDDSVESRNRKVLEALKKKGIRPEHLQGMTVGLTPVGKVIGSN